MLTTQGTRRRQAELRDMAMATRGGFAEGKLDELFPVAEDPALKAAAPDAEKFVESDWWEDE